MDTNFPWGWKPQVPSKCHYLSAHRHCGTSHSSHNSAGTKPRPAAGVPSKLEAVSHVNCSTEVASSGSLQEDRKCRGCSRRGRRWQWATSWFRRTYFLRERNTKEYSKYWQARISAVYSDLESLKPCYTPHPYRRTHDIELSVVCLRHSLFGSEIVSNFCVCQLIS